MSAPTPSSGGSLSVTQPPRAGIDRPARTAPLLLHEEPDTPTRANPAAAWHPDLLNRLLAAESPAERQQIVRTQLSALGFETLVFASYTRQDAVWMPRAFFTTYANVDWLRRYFDAGYYRVDPRLERAMQSSVPCTWSIDSLERWCDGGAPSSIERAFVADLRLSGARSGTLMALPIGDASDARRNRHLITLASRRDGRDWLDDALLGRALTLGVCLNELYGNHLGFAQPAAAPAVDSTVPGLTPTQRRILDGVGRGLCDKRIASELGLSAHNVDYHLRQLRRRFGVHNRVQLARAAARIAPR
jgi:DNA-binding CsgD family transcriptional regulator